MTTESRVYIANQGGHDYVTTKATSFGTLHYLTSGDINPTGVDRLAMQLATGLKDSNENDFFLLSGHSVINAIAATIIMLKHGRINFLVFDAKQRGYVRRTITGQQLESILDGNKSSASAGQDRQENS